MNSKQIQHIYHKSEGGFAVYDRTEVITVAHADYKTEILHLVLESLPTREEVLDLLNEVAEERVDKGQTFYDMLPTWIAFQ